MQILVPDEPSFPLSPHSPFPNSREAVYPNADPLSLPLTAPNRIHPHSMSQSTQASSTLPTVAGIKAGNEERRASPSASRPAGSMTIATEGEGGLAYFHKMMAQGGPAETGESELHTSDALIPSTYMPNPLNSSFTCNQYPPTACFGKTSNAYQPISNLPVSRFRDRKARLNPVCHSSSRTPCEPSGSVSRRRQGASN